MDNVSVTLNGDASFAAPNLLTYRNSSIPVNPSRDFQSGTLTNVYGSSITVSGGSTYTIAAPDFTMPGFSTYSYPPKNVLSASGAGSVLNAALVRKITMTGADYGWDPDINGWRGDFTFFVLADNQGTVDLSGLQEAYGGDLNSYGGNDWLGFRILNGGSILLPNLKQALRVPVLLSHVEALSRSQSGPRNRAVPAADLSGAAIVP